MLLGGLGALAACARPDLRAPAACPLPWQAASISLRLYFGRALPDGGLVSEADWARFAAEKLTPAFPKGFTVLATQGQWRGASGAVAREPGFLVEHDGALDARAIAGVIAAYRARFHQESVGVVTAPICASFSDSPP